MQEKVKDVEEKVKAARITVSSTHFSYQQSIAIHVVRKKYNIDATHELPMWA